jgi:hypothetical protein
MSTSIDVILKRFETPDEVREFARGRFVSWVVGDEPYVSLHFLGASHYAK